ncbi:MAG: sigma 54-interacting transcriptional regulator, partial [Myxococcota bacterium]
GTALSELFGHRRGAFTGAGGGRDGYFGQADTGSLFLDEIGEASSEVQVMLLRAIETGEIRPLGAHGVHRVDVRLITATDADLEQAVDAGAFRLPLLHRLAGFEMRVPPLRRRRDDIGRLLVHFLRQELQATGESHRLEPPERPGAAPWLPPALVARLARGQWPGNVRQLRNAARQIAIANYGLSSFRWPSAWPSTAGPDQARSSSAEPGDTPQPANRRRQNRIHGGRQGVRLDISEQALIAALRANRWRPGPTATALGIARASLYNLMNQYGSIRQARDLDRDEILACAQQCDGDLDAMVDRLEVSKRSLKLRMTELGLPYE